jgi:hypothetical protein
MRSIPALLLAALGLLSAAAPIVAEPPPLTPPAPILPDAPLPVTPPCHDADHPEHPVCPPEALDHDAPCKPPEKGGLVAGATEYYLKPYFQDNVAFNVTRGIGTTASSVTAQAFDWGVKSSAAFWVGYELESGLGVRGRYFNLSGSSRNLTTSLDLTQAATGFIAPPAALLRLPGAAFGSPGIFLTAGLGADQLGFDSDLHIEAYDVEATYEMCHENLSVVYAAGGRYLHTTQNYRATLTNSNPTDPITGLTGSEVQTLTYFHNFEGGGPTMALSATWQVGKTGLAIFGSARGSLLVGTTNEALTLTQSVVDPARVVGGNQNNVPRSIGSADRVMPVLELEAGLEFGMRIWIFRPFLRAAVVNQTYFDIGNASSTRGSLGLFGAQVSLGTNY